MDVPCLLRFAIVLLLTLVSAPLQGDEPLPAGAKLRLGSTRLRHGGTICAVVFSSDGKQVASAGEDRKVRVWDTRTGRQLVVCEGTRTAAPSLCFSPDGKQLAAASYYRGTHVWDAASGDLLWRAEQAGGSSLVAWAPDGKVLACGGANGTITLWTASGKLRHTLGPYPQGVLALGFTPDSEQVLTLHGDAVLRRWKVADGKSVRELALPPEQLTRHGKLVFSPDGKWLAFGQSDAGLRLWSAEEARAARVLGTRALPPAVHALCFAPDGRYLAAPGGKNNVLIWDVAAGREVRALPESPRPVGGLAFSPDGKTLAVCRDSAVQLWDAGTGKPLLGDERTGASVRDVVFLEGGRKLATLHDDDTVRGWDGGTGKEIGRLPERCLHWYGLGVLEDGKTVRALTDSFSWIDWQPGGRKTAVSLPAVTTTVLGPAAPDGRTFLQADKDGVYVSETTTNREIVKLPARKNPAGSMAYAPEGRRVALADADNAYRVWDLDTGRAFPSLGVSPDGPLASAPVLLSPGGRMLAQLRGRDVRVWEAASGRERLNGSLAARPVTAACFTPDGRALVLGLQTGDIVAVSLDTTDEYHQRSGHRGPVRALRFSADGKLLASGSDDTTTLVWDAAGFLAPRKQAEKPAPDELARWWGELADEDPARAYPALGRLSDCPAEAVALVRAKLKPVESGLGQRIDRLITSLDNRRFQVREQAVKELGELASEAEAALRRALEKKPTLETRRRIEELLERAKGGPTGTRMRLYRAVEVLDRAGTPEARALLKELAGGEPNAALTLEAKAALRRPE